MVGAVHEPTARRSSCPHRRPQSRLDNTPAAFDTVLARTKTDGIGIGLLDAFDSITIH
ncbi:hypothetical protein [Streptomyces sp. NBC_00344]|uniref:hypothetical protein n=1 Tax=Streptomyces sp. NBC_00344 TaxID=2975720 RepID=UPI002E1DFA1A